MHAIRSLVRCWTSFATALFGILAPLAAEPVVVINEFKCDPPGNDTSEFLELFAYDPATGEGVPQWALDGYVVVFFNGNSAINAAYSVTPVGGVATAALDLSGRTTNAAGFFVIGSPAVSAADIQLTAGAIGWFQNGADGVGLYKNPGLDFTTSTGAMEAGLVDAIVYGTDDLEDGDLLAILTPGGMQINESPNSIQAMARVPDGGPSFAPSMFAPQLPTPGSMNQPVDRLTLVLDPPTLTEGANRLGRVSRSGTTAGAVTVTVASSDEGEATAPPTVVIAAGETSAPVEFVGVDDLWPDGTELVDFTVTAPGYVSAHLAVAVADNGDQPQPLVINEVFASGFGDANQDGAHATNQDRFNDEFVEIVNRGSEEVDLSGYRLFTSSIDSARHTFPDGTVVPSGGALVVFGGGVPTLGTTEAFGTAWIQTANAATFGLYLLESGARLSLHDADGREVAGFRYDHHALATDSLTRDPDVTGSLLPHGTLGDGSLFFSPGTRADGTPFFTTTVQLACTIEPARVVENAGAGAAWLTIRRDGPLTRPLVVTVLAHDPTEAVPAAASVTIPAGGATARLPIDAVDDNAIDGTQSAGFTFIAASHLNGSATLLVDDDGFDRPPLGVFVNEIDTDQPGADIGEFVELYVGERAARPLDGYVVVFFNGNHPLNGAYAVYDLTGRSSNAKGLFVIGNAAVPNVDLVIPKASIQNGADAVAVYRASASAFATGSNPSVPTPENLVDVVLYGNGSGEDADLVAAFYPFSEPPPPTLVQYNEGDPNNPHALARVPDATTPFGNFVAQPPTPGTPNEDGPGTPPTIHIAVEGNELVLTFTGTLEHSSTLRAESFAPVAGATSPHRVPLPTSGSLFYRAAAP